MTQACVCNAWERMVHIVATELRFHHLVGCIASTTDGTTTEMMNENATPPKIAKARSMTLHDDNGDTKSAILVSSAL